MPDTTETRLADPLRIRVRYCECDPMGVAHHSAYPVWFEMGRTEMYRRNGHCYRDLEAAGQFLAVVGLSVRYKRPARYDDVLDLHTRLTSTGRVKLEHSYELWRGDELIATGSTVLACVDRNGKLQPLPDSVTPVGIAEHAAS